MNIFKKFFAFLQLREAVKKANNAYRVTGQRYYVIPSMNRNKRQLLVLDRSNFRKLKRKGYISEQAVIRDLIKESFYFTPYRDGNGFLSETDRRIKVKQYYDWVAYHSHKKK